MRTSEQIIAAKKIIANGGSCVGVMCDYCPANYRCINHDEISKWLQNWLDANDTPEQRDTVDKPDHYTTGKIETIDIIRDSVADFTSYCHGNIIKYVSRYRHKNGVEDLKKAQVYLNWLIEELEK